MSAKNFKFISPGVFLSEIDKSRLPSLPDIDGPCIIGTADMGPAFQPVQITNQEEFVSVFGAPSVGVGAPTGDPSRDGVHALGVDYGAWAAFGYLANNSPVTFVRILGDNHSDALSGAGASAGWSIAQQNSRGGAYGLFVASTSAPDFIDLEVKQTADAAAAHVVEVEIPEIAQADYVQDTISIVLKGDAVGADDLVITSANIAAADLQAGDAPTLATRRSTIAEALETALDADLPQGMTAALDAAAGSATKVTITGPDTGLTFTVVAVDEPDGVENATVTVTTQGVTQGVVPTAGRIIGLDPDDHPHNSPEEVELSDAEAAALASVTAERAAAILARAIDTKLNDGVANPIATVQAIGRTVRISPLQASSKLFITDNPANAAAGGSMFNVSASVATSTGENLEAGANEFTVVFGGAGSLSEGQLAAIFHAQPDVQLKLVTNRSTAVNAAADVLMPASANGRFNIAALAGGNTVTEYSSFNLQDIRNLNCDPTLLNSSVTAPDERKVYFLAESFEGDLRDTHGNILLSNSMRAVLLPLGGGSSFEFTQTPAETPWIRGNFQGDHAEFDTSSLEPLFKIVALDSGESGNKWKVGISNIVFPTGAQRNLDPYPTFTVTIMPWGTMTNMASAGRSFTQCNLNPNSTRFIGRKIGTQYQVYDDSEKRARIVGEYRNNDSRFRVELAPKVEAGSANPALAPVAFHGPQSLARFDISTGGWNTTLLSTNLTAKASQMRLYTGSAFDPDVPQSGLFFGVNTCSTPGTEDPSYLDLVKKAPSGLTSNLTESQFVFSLEFVVAGIDSGDGSAETRANGSVVSEDSKCFYYDTRGRPDVDGTTQHNGHGIFDLEASIAGNPDLPGNQGLIDVCERVSGFIVPMTGGFDGFDIRNPDPICERVLDGVTDERASSAYYSIAKCLSIVSDPEVVEYNILSVPGVVNSSLTDKIMNQAQRRGDALSVIDIPGLWTPRSSRYVADQSSRRGDIKAALSLVKGRSLNNSYACAYAPWVRSQLGGVQFYLPPSVAGIGTLGSSAATSQLWFAPAGFNRGGLDEGSAGISVEACSHHLTSKERDLLYDLNINPIASFPANNIVIFGQKTLQGFDSALDRINVRRLLIFVKKRVSLIARGLLFEPNMAKTWARFKSPVDNFLGNIQAGGGLSEYRVVLDTTTTTPDLIDRNIMYAKVLLKPTRAIEFIAVDFVITNTGASFDDP